MVAADWASLFCEVIFAPIGIWPSAGDAVEIAGICRAAVTDQDSGPPESGNIAHDA